MPRLFSSLSINHRHFTSIHTQIAQTATDSCIDSLHLFTCAVKDIYEDKLFWIDELAHKFALLKEENFKIQPHNSVVMSNPSLQEQIVMRFTVEWKVDR